MRLANQSLLVSIFGAGLWGFSGIAAQALFQIYTFPVLGLVTIRMIVAGSLLFVVFRPSHPTKPLLPLIALAIFGYIGSQLTYLEAIQYSNAATATLLQFLFLPIVAAYEAISGNIRWSHRWTLTMILAGIGTVLLIGGITLQILVTPLGLLFGLFAALGGAYYTLGSAPFVKDHGPWWTTTWGFLIGGLLTIPLGAASLISYPFPIVTSQTSTVLLLIGFVVVVGTMLAFGLYLSGLRHLSATEIGFASSAEPIVSAGAAYAFLGVVLTPAQYAGGALILVAVLLVASRREDAQRRSTP